MKISKNGTKGQLKICSNLLTTKTNVLTTKSFHRRRRVVGRIFSKRTKRDFFHFFEFFFHFFEIFVRISRENACEILSPLLCPADPSSTSSSPLPFVCRFVFEHILSHNKKNTTGTQKIFHKDEKKSIFHVKTLRIFSRKK